VIRPFEDALGRRPLAAYRRLLQAAGLPLPTVGQPTGLVAPLAIVARREAIAVSTRVQQKQPKKEWDSVLPCLVGAQLRSVPQFEGLEVPNRLSARVDPENFGLSHRNNTRPHSRVTVALLSPASVVYGLRRFQRH